MKKICLFILLIANIKLFAQAPIDSLSAFYPFNGNAHDESGRGSNGTIYNGVALVIDKNGDDSSAVCFDGIDDYIEIASNNNFNFTDNQQFTVSFFILPITKNGLLISKWGYGGVEDDDWFISLYNQKIYFHYHSEPNILNGNITFNDTIPLYQWTHIGITVDFVSKKIKLYINGNLSQTVDLLGNGLQYTYQRIFVGRRFNNDFPYLNGCLDEIRFYKRALWPTEIYYLAFEKMVCYKTISVTDTLIITIIPQGIIPPPFKKDIKVYPNPAKTQLTMDFGNDYSDIANYKIKIVNQSGEIIDEIYVYKQIYNTNINWSKGIYFMQIYDNKNNLLDIKKIVIR